MSHPLSILCGMPRSGTTWLGKIFDSHPDTLYLHEPDSVNRMRSLPIVADPAQIAMYRDEITRFVAGLPHIRHPKVVASLPVFPKSYYSAVKYRLACTAAIAAKGAGRLMSDVAVPRLVDFDSVPRLHLVWKSIELTGALGTVLRALPESRGILILRHPCGYIASVMRGESTGRFEGDVASANDYGVFDLLLATTGARSRQLTRKALEAMDGIERLAWRWVLFNEKAMEDLQPLSNWCLAIYEDLCRNPVREARKLFDFAGLTWDKQVEEFIHRSTSSDHSGYYAVHKDPLKAANKWQNEMSREDIDRVMRIVAQSSIGQAYTHAS